MRRATLVVEEVSPSIEFRAVFWNLHYVHAGLGVPLHAQRTLTLVHVSGVPGIPHFAWRACTGDVWQGNATRGRQQMPFSGRLDASRMGALGEVVARGELDVAALFLDAEDVVQPELHRRASVFDAGVPGFVRLDLSPQDVFFEPPETGLVLATGLPELFGSLGVVQSVRVPVEVAQHSDVALDGVTDDDAALVEGGLEDFKDVRVKLGAVFGLDVGLVDTEIELRGVDVVFDVGAVVDEGVVYQFQFLVDH